MCMLQSLWAGVAPDIRGQLYSDISPYRVSEYSLFRPCVTVLCFTIAGHRASPWFFIIVFCTHFLTNCGSTFLRKCNLFVIGCIEPLSDRANQRLTCEKNGFNVFTHLAPRREIYTPKKLFLKGLLVQCAISGLFLVYFRSFSTKHQYYFTTN